MSTTEHSILTVCVDCGSSAVQIDGRCAPCRRFLAAEQKLHDLALELGQVKGELRDVSEQRDRLKRQVLDLDAAHARTEATIDSVRHQGLRRLLWIARGTELEELLAEIGAGQRGLVELAESLLDETNGCDAESLVQEALGLIE